MEKIGDYFVRLTAQDAEFRAGLKRAVDAAESSGKRMTKEFESTRATFRTLLGAITGAGIGWWSRQMIQNAESLQDLSEATGSTVESLSRLQNIAKINGDQFETFKGAMERLAAGMAGAEEGSSKTAEALRFLGVTATDPARALEEIAKKLDGFSDGVGKAALVKDLFGRTGVGFIATLKQIAQSGEQAATVTTQQAAEASRLAEAYRSLQVNSTTLSNALLSGLVPAAAKMVEEFIEGTRVAGGFLEALRLFGPLKTSTFENIGKQIREVTDEIEEANRVSHGAFYDLLSKLSGDFFGRAADSSDPEKRLRLLKFRQRQLALDLISPANEDARDIRARTKPALPYVSSPAGGRKVAEDDPTRKLLEGALKAIEAYTEEEREILKTRQEYLDRYFSAGNLGIEDYFKAKEATQAEDLRVTLEGIDKEIAALERYKEAKNRTKVEIADTENKIGDLQKKRVLAEQQNARSGVLLWFEQRSEAEKYARTLDDINTRLLEMTGDTLGALRRRQRAQNGAARSLFERNGDTEALEQLDRLERQEELQVRLNNAQQDFGLILDEIGVKHQLIAAGREAGTLTELEALAQVSAANKAHVAQLEEVAEAYRRLAETSGDPRFLLAAEQMRVKLEEIKATGDLVAKKFNDIGAGAFADALQALATGQKSFKEAALDFGKNVSTSITRVVADNLAQKAFGKDGIFSGFGDLFSGLFGGAESGAVALTGSATALSGSAAALSAAAGALTAAAAASSASSFGSSFSNIFQGSGGGGFADILTGLQGFAAGGNPPVGRLSLVGERGPELIFPRAPMTVAPLAVAAGGGAGRRAVTITQHINVLPGASTQSARQAAAAVRDSTVRAIKDR